MSITLIVVLALAAVLVLWVISVQNRLVKIDELCNNSLKQIQVQQMSRYDALKTIVSLARESAQVEGENFEKIINARKITTSPARPSTRRPSRATRSTKRTCAFRG